MSVPPTFEEFDRSDLALAVDDVVDVRVETVSRACMEVGPPITIDTSGRALDIGTGQNAVVVRGPATEPHDLATSPSLTVSPQ